jgi:hypothetical protein
VNGDGRPDIICKEGFWAAPKDPIHGSWTWVPANLGEDCAHMYAVDLNGDGLPDVLSSSAHRKGFWWWEQRKGANGPEFIKHTIDDSFSQSHSLMMADLNGDGRPDFVTGKRWWAHGPNGDVEPNATPMLYWYEYKRVNGTVEWTRHEIDNDAGIGTQFALADLNGDGRIDIAISNKRGVVVFEQQ